MVGKVSISEVETYKSIRTEVIEQKKCQFQILSAAIAFTSAIWAYAFSLQYPLIFMAPVLMNLMALLLIIDKAVSIQRMVGYLQCMETMDENVSWAWESHLDTFRGENPKVPKKLDRHDARKHSYVTTVGRLLLAMSLLSIGLYLALSVSVERINLLDFSPVAIRVNAIAGGVFLIVLAVAARFSVQRRRLRKGKFCSTAIRNRWHQILTSSAHE